MLAEWVYEVALKWPSSEISERTRVYGLPLRTNYAPLQPIAFVKYLSRALALGGRNNTHQCRAQSSQAEV